MLSLILVPGGSGCERRSAATIKTAHRTRTTREQQVSRQVGVCGSKPRGARAGSGIAAHTRGRAQEAQRVQSRGSLTYTAVADRLPRHVQRGPPPPCTRRRRQQLVARHQLPALRHVLSEQDPVHAAAGRAGQVEVHAVDWHTAQLCLRRPRSGVAAAQGGSEGGVGGGVGGRDAPCGSGESSSMKLELCPTLLVDAHSSL